MAPIDANRMVLSPVKLGGFILRCRWRSYVVKVGVAVVGTCDIREMTAVTGSVEKLLIRRFGGLVICVTFVITSAGFVTEGPRDIASWNGVVANAKIIHISKAVIAVSFSVARM